jgi:hypothetical protein
LNIEEQPVSKEKSQIAPFRTRAETAIDVVSFVSSALPWIGGPVSNVLSGISAGRKMARVREIIEGLVSDLKEFKSEASETYVKTDEFQELLEHALGKAADERNQGKRQAYRAFLTDAVKSPGVSYDEQIRSLRILEELQVAHLKVLRALMDELARNQGSLGLQFPSLQMRLPEMQRDHIRDLVLQLNNMGVTNIVEKGQILSLTPFGQRLIRFIVHN